MIFSPAVTIFSCGIYPPVFLSENTGQEGGGGISMACWGCDPENRSGLLSVFFSCFHDDCALESINV